MALAARCEGQAGGYGEIFFVFSVLSIIVLLVCWLVKVPALEAVADSRKRSEAGNFYLLCAGDGNAGSSG